MPGGALPTRRGEAIAGGNNHSIRFNAKIAKQKRGRKNPEVNTQTFLP